MMRGMSAAISGLEVHQTMLDVTANNLANVDTPGYKGERASFIEQLTQLLTAGSGSSGGNAGSNPLSLGLGVQLGSVDQMMTAGAFQTTNNPLDVAIEGDGFLRVGQGTPPATPPYTTGLPSTVNYTRAGSLQVDSKGFVTTAAGDYVVGKNAVAAGAPPNVTYTPGATDSFINVPPGSTDVAVGSDGAVSYVDQNSLSPTYQQRVTAGYLSLATFPNESGLERAGGSLWLQSPNSGSPAVNTPGQNGAGTVVSGELEQSNVDLATEFTNMITAERGYEANSRVITTADQMLQTAVQMKS